ncbi:MAG: Transcription elongation factor GreA [Chloroflexi bacterium ADurb.Bin120]|jgi:transcription elongation factor GreA|uniref:Transcription elongation factor GreA n=1 Tax=Candidatus Brevifilum fermentans TaxID=1986204 RepID=A0A1Y6K146_9CHLR|nr:transcription elongation factor GreA [Brevefilum fermentans]OQB85937.1 MAG: Transcription elongation factor GreA [Chloroflexi bacterium ADurb.Bin120]SMX53374.1 Transcription elongation factor GreA [Brevefilum fermentans]HOM67188.1 transcription elongation factor GreA [Brevefilum fermentans]
MASSYLTREGYEKLQQELEYLKTEKRVEVADRLREALEDGELIENAELEAAKNEQSFVEGRIKELEILLASAYLIDESTQSETVQVGSKVTIQEEGLDPEEYMIVGAAEADPRLGRISNESPLGKALLNHKVGDRVKVEAPRGEFEIEILSVG